MLKDEAEKKWSLELERRKKKVIEEEQNRINDFNAAQRTALIFSDIFRVVPKLKPPFQRRRKKLKKRLILLEKNTNEVKQEHTESKEPPKKSSLSVPAHNPYQVPDELLGAYLSKLRRGFKN
jgi:hypothetical protein